MRTLFINSVYGTGSTGKIIADMVALMQKSGHVAKALYGIGPSVCANGQNAVKICGQSEYYFHNFMSRMTDHAGLYSRRAARWIIQEIQAFQPDVIHLHTLHGYYVNYELLFDFLKKAEIPLVWTLHDCWSFTGHCTHFSQEKCMQWKTMCQNCSQLSRYPKCYFGGDVKNNYLRKKAAFTGLSNVVLTVPSRWLAEQVTSSFLGNYPIRVIHNGVDRSIFYPQNGNLRQQYQLQNKKIVLGVANVWDQRKGMEDFFSLSQMLDKKFQIVMIGFTNKQMRNLPENVLGIQRTANQTELAQWYSEADVFVNPTYEETFGLTTIEAQACGTPVVVYQTDGCPETVVPGNGTLVPQGDLEELKEAIEIILNEGKQADPQSMSQFDKDYIYQDYLSLFQQMMQGKFL